MEKNPWSLFESMKGWRTAHRALEAGWKVAAKKATIGEACQHMFPIMDRYREFGACDTEGNAELDRRLENRYRN
jgi:hypothetical protein